VKERKGKPKMREIWRRKCEIKDEREKGEGEVRGWNVSGRRRKREEERSGEGRGKVIQWSSQFCEPLSDGWVFKLGKFKGGR
jgi:hypothetical protein